MNNKGRTIALGLVMLLVMVSAYLVPWFLTSDKPMEAASTATPAAPEPWNDALKAKAKKAIFNTTLYSDQPGQKGQPTGMREDMKIIYGFMGPDFKGNVWVRYPGENDDDLKYLVRQAVEMGVTRLLLDVEDENDAVRNTKILHKVAVIKAIAPTMLVGNFAYPRNDFLATLAQNAKANDAMKDVMAQLDFGCGAAYTACLVPQEIGKWKTFMQGIVSEGHRVMPGKEIYVALGVTYSDYGWQGPILDKGPLDPNMLVREIKSCFASGADGVLLWGSTRSVRRGTNDNPAPWDAKDPWYQAIKENDLLSVTTEGAATSPAETGRAPR